MFRKYLLSFALLAIFSFAQAATTTVTPGVGTLKAAIDSAADGDVLLLQGGAPYGLNAPITIDVGLTIRPEDGTHEPAVHLSNFNITVSSPTGVGAVTIQGLDFVGGGTGGFIRLLNAKDFNLLENTFSGVTLDLDSVTGGYKCYIIGNTSSRSSYNYDVYSDVECYVAGNTFEGVYQLVSYSTYFIGNRVVTSSNSQNPTVLYSAFNIGNEFVWDVDANTALGAAQYFMVRAYTPYAPYSTYSPLYVNNIFKVIGSGPPTDILGMEALRTEIQPQRPQIRNNVIDYSSFTGSSQSYGGMIYSRYPSFLQSNIIVNGLDNSMNALGFYNASTRDNSEISYNLCYNNAAHCGTTDGNLTSSPAFVNFTDYQLEAFSPAVDAGPPNEHLADLDGSTNDMGIHGGPHPIGQYKAQRAPAATAPFVYPVFEEIQTLAGAQINVSAIGVARFK